MTSKDLQFLKATLKKIESLRDRFPNGSPERRMIQGAWCAVTSIQFSGKCRETFANSAVDWIKWSQK